MAETNGTSRLDRIEAVLERVADRLDKVATMGYLHDEKMSRIEANLEQMQEDEAAYRKLQKDRDLVIDGCIDKLVSSIGVLITRLPA